MKEINKEFQMKLIKTRNEIERFKKTQETDKNNEQRQNEWEIIKKTTLDIAAIMKILVPVNIC